uniref:Uncharacterized protein n=1 Tax=Oryza rufipogon TaxID=4529 RepID=A0A0E0PB04_ORYRU
MDKKIPSILLPSPLLPTSRAPPCPDVSPLPLDAKHGQEHNNAAAAADEVVERGGRRRRGEVERGVVEEVAVVPAGG